MLVGVLVAKDTSYMQVAALSFAPHQQGLLPRRLMENVVTFFGIGSSIQESLFLRQQYSLLEYLLKVTAVILD